MRHRVAPLLAAFVVLAFSKMAWSETMTTEGGYRFIYDVYPGDGPAALIFMHGRNSTHVAPLIKSFAQSIADGGVTVYMPRMPWSRQWDGTAADATAVLDLLVKHAAESGKQVFVGGQSMGAMFAMSYRPKDPPPGMIGKVLTSPGALLDLMPASAKGYWGALIPATEKAKSLEAQGKAMERTIFTSTNVVGAKQIEEQIETTPEIWLSFHDTSRFPSLRASLRMTVSPVFWSSGNNDPVPASKKASFALMPSNPASRYLETDGDHNSNMTKSVDAILAWMKARLAS